MKLTLHTFLSIDGGSNTANGLNNLPKYVATSTPLEPVWNDSTALTGDIIKQVEELKAKPGRELQIHGSAGLARSLHQAGLIDEYRLLTFPAPFLTGTAVIKDGTSTFSVDS